MRSLLRLILFFTIPMFFVFLIGCGSSEEEKKATTSDLLKIRYKSDIDAFKNAVLKLENKVKINSSETKIQESFKEARLEYKRIEFLVEYFNPATAKSLNGPALEEVEEDDPLKIPVPPEGFQVIEELIFPALESDNKLDLKKELKILLSNVNRLELVTEQILISDSHFFDAVRLQLIRIISLGLSGFDSPVANFSIQEAKSSFESINDYLLIYQGDQGLNEFSILTNDIKKAIAFLSTSETFNSFDRFHFISNNFRSVYRSLLNLQKKIDIGFTKDLKAISSTQQEIFSEKAFNVNYFAPNFSSHISNEKVELGKVLFYDPILSGNNQRSCASCHDPEKGFADGRKKSVAFNFKMMVKRNAPTLLNAGLQGSQFYDTRVMFLEDQANDVLLNEEEMHGSLKAATDKIKLSEEYINLFKEAFPDSQSPVSEKNLKIALASFTRSLVSFNSAFDKNLRKESESLTTDQIKGFNIFMGKGKCGTCHFMPLFNGAVPPLFDKTETEVIGVPTHADLKTAGLDDDLGRFVLQQADKYKNAFKTPSLRNIALTSPYMHNGVFNTLEEVVEFYDMGGGRGIGLDVPNQTLPEDKLNLSNEEKKDLIAFMNSLTDTTGLTGKVKKLPVLNSKHDSFRKPGGLY